MRIFFHILLVLFFTELSYSQVPPEFSTFEGDAFNLTRKDLKKGYGEYVYDRPKIGTVSWEKILVPEGHTDDGFPDVSKATLFALVLSSKMTIHETACYEMQLSSDDGSKLWIDDQLIIDNDYPHKMTLKKDTVALTKGTYDVKVWYYSAYPFLYGFIFDAFNIGDPCSNAIRMSERLKFPYTISFENKVLFDIDKYNIKDEARIKLDSVINIIKAYDAKIITVAGHTDSSGSNFHNEVLSVNRANSIKSFLKDQCSEIDLEFSVYGMGERQPTATNDDASGRTLNRRVEITLNQPKPE